MDIVFNNGPIFIGIMKVTHIKRDCISCGACAALYPDQWAMDNEGLAQLLDSVKVGNNFEKSLELDQVNDYQEAESVCPVNIILVDTE